MKFPLTCVVSFFALVSGRLPSGIFPKCNKNDPELSQCLIDAIDVVRPLLKAGIPEISLPSLDPFEMAQLPMHTTVEGISLRGVAKNIQAKGGGNFIITDIGIDKDRKTVGVSLTIPQLDVSAEYDCIGSTVAVFRFNGTGHFTGSFPTMAALLINMAPTRTILNLFKPTIQETAAEIIQKYVNKVLSQLPVQDILE